MKEVWLDVAANGLGLLGFVLLAIPGVKAVEINREVKRLTNQIGTFKSKTLDRDIAEFAQEQGAKKDDWKPVHTYMLWAGLLLSGGSYAVVIAKDFLYAQS